MKYTYLKLLQYISDHIGSSSGSLVQCSVINYKNGSIVSFNMDKVGVMEAFSDPLCVCVVHCI